MTNAVSLPGSWSTRAYENRHARGVEGYVRELLFDLESTFQPLIDDAFERLLNVKFNTAGFEARHRALTRHQLVQRHCLPFGLVVVDQKAPSPFAVDYLVVALLAHTGVLTHLDKYTDGAPGASDAGDQLLDAGYSLAALFTSSTLASRLPNGPLLVAECFPVSAFVTERMFRDHEERWLPLPNARSVSELCEQYLWSPISRLLGSGYLEVFARAAASSAGERLSGVSGEALLALRRLRQLTDEIIDLEEDLAAGLLTFPILMLLRERYDEVVERCGVSVLDLATNKDTLFEILRSSSVPELLMNYVHHFHAAGVQDLESEGLTALSTMFHLRVAYLETSMPGTWMEDSIRP